MNLIHKTRLSMSLSGSERQINVSNLRLKSYSCVNFTNSIHCHQKLIAFAPWQTRERRERVCRRRSWLKVQIVGHIIVRFMKIIDVHLTANAR